MEEYKRRITENEAFVTLIDVAREKGEIKEKLTNILKQDPFHRKSILNTYINEMKLQGADKDFIEAVSYLLDDEIAEKALKFINES